ncbi:hypothetical protein CEXT_678251 [Caerostris extrusa]|uniref:Uncharacterized protein n=1 Tax=Caerostris extrusa TaxID=172846 RepID=A0AAV4VPY9_CAEEX|nr:hypothetical protein CEXT_678251 [Caerostris extrusa]
MPDISSCRIDKWMASAFPRQRCPCYVTLRYGPLCSYMRCHNLCRVFGASAKQRMLHINGSESHLVCSGLRCGRSDQSTGWQFRKMNISVGNCDA